MQANHAQDVILSHVHKGQIPVMLFLVGGIRLQGVVTRFDTFCVLLRRDGQLLLVYKRAISTIMPEQPVPLFEEHAESVSAPSGLDSTPRPKVPI